MEWKNTARARDLRGKMTGAEEFLWSKLRGRQLGGVKFRRQQSVGPYVMDFFCAAAKLAVELDGAIHEVDWQKGYDHERTRYLEAGGIRVLR